MKRIIEIIKNPLSIVDKMRYTLLFAWIPDKIYLRIIYRSLYHKKLDLNKPNYFNEKLQWLKIYDRNPLYTTLVDKYAVRSIVERKIGVNYLIPLVGGPWNKVSDIEIDRLPQQFVLKCTHNSGGVFVCKDKSKVDWKEIGIKFERELKRNYFYSSREWPYKNIKPQIIAECYVEDEKQKDLPDYKFYCFHGEPKYCQVIKNRHTEQTIDFFDMDWKHQEFTGFSQFYKPHSKCFIEKPIQLQKMIEFSKILSKNIPFVRVDFYEANEKIYIGEMTFYPASGFGQFYPFEWNKYFGDMINLENK